MDTSSQLTVPSRTAWDATYRRAPDDGAWWELVAPADWQVEPLFVNALAQHLRERGFEERLRSCLVVPGPTVPRQGGPAEASG